MPRVSVVMAVYNNEETLERAIESIRNQTFTDWELITCDDSSKDNSYVLLQQYMKKDSRIMAVRNDKNQGPAYTRNRCIEISRGEYIAILDGDDFAHPDRFDRQVKFLDNEPEFAFVGSNVILFDEEGNWGERKFKPVPEKKDFLKAANFCHPSIIYRKSALLEVSCFRVAKETRRGQDVDLYMRMYSKGMKGYNLQEFLLYYYEGKLSLPRIPFRHRMNSVILRYKGYKALGLMPIGFFYILKPLFVGIIPKKFLRKLKKRIYGTVK